MLLFGFLAASVAATNASTTKSYDIRVGAVTLRVPFPAGFCSPKGERAASFKRLAAPDHRNVTLLSLVDCNSGAASHRYLLIKTPVADVDVAFDRDGLIKELSQAAREPDFEATVQAMPKQVGAEKSAETGVRTNLVGEYRPRGHDEVCLYFGGSMATTRRGVTQNQAAGSCLTVVGTRFIALHAYENSADPQAYKNLLPGLKQWALRIHRVQPR